MKRLLIIVLALTPLHLYAATPARLTFFPIAPLQGDTLIIKLTQKPTALTWNSQAVTVFPYGSTYSASSGQVSSVQTFRALIPLAATAKTGTYPLVATFPDGTIEQRMIEVTKATFTVINLPVPPKLNETPAQLVTSLVAVNKNINATVNKPTEQLYFSEPFVLPLYNNRTIGSQFGEVRKTGSEEIRHLGTDFTAKTGTPVAAINAGMVSKSYLDTTYGETVIIDHGYGIYTLYMHLNTRTVKAGDMVKKGTLIGTVGETGYASGPHLHLSIKINGTSVDPLRFVRLFR